MPTHRFVIARYSRDNGGRCTKRPAAGAEQGRLAEESEPGPGAPRVPGAPPHEARMHYFRQAPFPACRGSGGPPAEPRAPCLHLPVEAPFSPAVQRPCRATGMESEISRRAQARHAPGIRTIQPSGRNIPGVKILPMPPRNPPSDPSPDPATGIRYRSRHRKPSPGFESLSHLSCGELPRTM